MRRLIIAPILLLFVLISGTTGYIIIENWTLLDAFYMTVITIATVGFHEVGQLSQAGRLFTTLLIFFGIGVGGYAIGNITAFLVEGEIWNFYRGRKMLNQISKLKNHVILCGYGKIGVEVAKVLQDLKKSFVIIESVPEKVNDALEEGYLAIQGDGTDEDMLEKCGIKCAFGLISAISNDSSNVYLVLTAREMNNKLRIVARGVGDLSAKKLLKAGADKVISPYSIAGTRMASILVKPEIIEFIDVMTESDELELKLEEVILSEKSLLVNKQLNQSNIKQETEGAMVMAIKKKGKKMIINPPGNMVLESEDILVALGNNAQLVRLREIAE